MKEKDLFLDSIESLKIKYKAIDQNDDIKVRIGIISALIDDNNTDEEFITEYLKLNKEIGAKNFKDLLKEYELCINSVKFNNLFGDVYKINSPFTKFDILFKKLKNIMYKDNYDEQLFEIIKIIEMKNNKYDQHFPIFYYSNKELYFNSLYYLFLKEIQKNYKKAKKLIKDDNLNDYKNKYQNKLKDLQINNSNKNDIEIIKKIINYIYLCLTSHFHNYIINLSIFIINIYNSFIYKFKSNDIFMNEKYELNQKKDINLFTDFIFFLIRFDFEKDKKITQYERIWNDTFLGAYAKEGDLLKSKMISMDIKEDTLLVKIHSCFEKTIKIENINIYSIDKLNCTLMNFQNDLDIFDLNDCLKIDKYDTELFIKKKWDQFSEYICDILCSPVIKSVFSKTFNFEPDILNNKGYLRKILNEIRFFSFDSNFTAETKKIFLLVYIQSYISNNSTKDINIKKLIYLAIFLISCFHEIVGHLSLRIHNYLFKENQVNSPKPDFPSNYGLDRKKESGEFIEGKLFGNYKYQMSIKQILFILDINNYQYENSDSFMEKFVNLKNEEINISQKLNEILNIYEITIDDIEIGSKTLYTVNKSKCNDPIIFPPHHSISQIDSDDD